jgi:hypothetical protein
MRYRGLRAQCEAAGFTEAALGAALTVERLRPRIEGGEGGAVLDAIGHCAEHHLVMPAWLADEFLRRHGAVGLGFARDWNDARAFGNAYPKGTNIAGIRARVNDAPAAYRMAAELLAADPARPIDVGLYEAIGERIGVKRTRAAELLAQAIADGGDTLPPLTELRARLAAGLDVAGAVRDWQNEQFAARRDEFDRPLGYAPGPDGVLRKADTGK